MRPEGQVTLCCDRRGKIYTIDFLVVNLPNQKPHFSAEAIHGRKTKVVKAQTESASMCNTVPSSLLEASFTKRVVS